MPDTPETEVINEMETPVELSEEEMTDSRFSYDLPRNDSVTEGESEEDAVATNASADDSSEAPEEDNNSEVPGDPRPPHQTQPPTGDQY